MSEADVKGEAGANPVSTSLTNVVGLDGEKPSRPDWSRLVWAVTHEAPLAALTEPEVRHLLAAVEHLAGLCRREVERRNPGLPRLRTVGAQVEDTEWRWRRLAAGASDE